MIIALLTASLVLLVLVPAAMAAILLLEVGLGVWAWRKPVGSPGVRGAGRVAVLVPAHNESAGLIPTLADLEAQMRKGDTMLVVADNCTDDTAEIAARSGAEVVVRSDLERRGKGHALAFGVAHLRADPPAVVVIVDADCRVAPGSLDALAAVCASTGRPAQALDLMLAPQQSGIGLQVAEFAWRIKNWLRPLGLRAAGLPCHLMGTGMAFPWDVLARCRLASGNLTEDIALGLDLAAVGKAAMFCPQARVTSEFPTSADAAHAQRQRWEQGHISTILGAVPRLLASAVAQRNWHLLVLALDIAVLPLSLLAVLTVAAVALGALGALLGLGTIGLVVSLATVLMTLLSIGLAWGVCGRDLLPGRKVIQLPLHALGKLGFYKSLASGGGPSRWVRTDRG
jgi:cellulose synthase/poly-beta-1,6-N-acetylglucosamine synthase-like glycosyltransferase